MPDTYQPADFTHQKILEMAREIGFEPRDYQARLIYKTIQAFTIQNHKSVLVESPTGSGKSFLSLISLKILKMIYPNMTFGWVAMRKKLLEQACIENKRVGVKDIEFISMFDKNPPKVDMMITDESQHDSAATCAELHKTMEATYSYGITATPYRTDRIKLSYEKLINDYGVRFLIEQGYLSPFNQYVITKFTPTDVANIYLKDITRWGKSIIYMPDKIKCQQTLDILLTNNIKAEMVLGIHTDIHKESTYQRFESGETQVLINVYMLTEGFNSQDLQTVFVRDSGKLPTIQMVGRSLRKDQNNPNKVANVVQSEQTSYPYTKVTKAKTEWILQENEWRSMEPSDKVFEFSELVRKELLSLPVSLPTFLEGNGNSISIGKNGETIFKQVKKKRKNLF